LAQDYPETDALLKIAYPELQEKGRTEPRKFGFNSVVGLDKLKAHLREHVIAPLTEPPDDEYASPKPNGILFFGPSRTGKTNLANALADELGFRFKKVSSKDIFSPLQGQPILNVQKLFEEVRAEPTVLFIDEINQVVPNRRDMHNGHGDMARVVDEFLIQLDEAHRHGVFTIAATNLPTLLDNAVQQPGRLDTEIPIGLPDTKTKAALFPFFLKKYEQKPIQYEEGLFEELAAKAINFSPADIQQAVGTAICDYKAHGKKPSIRFYLEKAVQETKPGNSKEELQAFQDYITEKGLKNAVDS
jgi:SpoVK/Ycf46/Vps4 family AAA+-type ATPase